MRIEAELIQTEDGQLRIGKSKDRIDHWTAKSGEAIMADQDKDKDQCTLTGEMRSEADNHDNDDADMREDKVGVEPDQFDRSGSPAKETEEEITLASRAATPSERRLRTPKRNPARKRKTDISHDASQKRLSMDVEHDVASIDENVGVDMMFDEDVMT